jgi:hypothetical protein
MDKETQNKVREIIEEIFSSAISLETKELIYKLVTEKQ